MVRSRLVLSFLVARFIGGVALRLGGRAHDGHLLDADLICDAATLYERVLVFIELRTQLVDALVLVQYL